MFFTVLGQPNRACGRQIGFPRQNDTLFMGEHSRRRLPGIARAAACLFRSNKNSMALLNRGIMCRHAVTGIE